MKKSNFIALILGTIQNQPDKNIHLINEHRRMKELSF